MTLEQKVCSPKTAKRLNELGVKQKSLFYWTILKDRRVETLVMKHEDRSSFYHEIYIPEEHCIVSIKEERSLWVSAFTSSELGNMFKEKISKAFELCADYEHTVWQDNEIEARAEIIIRGIESGLLSV